MLFFENTGSATSPAFSAPQTNPFGLAAVSNGRNPALADLDGDGDLDAWIGDYFGNTILLENRGSAAAPDFAVPRTNPFGLAHVGYSSSPALADLDGDGDLDAWIGNGAGHTIFFENLEHTPVFLVTGKVLGLKDKLADANKRKIIALSKDSAITCSRW
jgi:hypothetical protein